MCVHIRMYLWIYQLVSKKKNLINVRILSTLKTYTKQNKLDTKEKILDDHDYKKYLAGTIYRVIIARDLGGSLKG